jgi:precorrin-6Y C5,15-methyltransferase (decarboxylating) CbiT subunit
MTRVSLPHDAKAGPTKPEVRAVLASKLALTGADHFAEVGSCTGAVTIEAARRAGRVTALERKEKRLDVTRKNLAANDVDADVELREAEAPEGLPDDADALFLGGSRNYEDDGVIVLFVCGGIEKRKRSRLGVSKQFLDPFGAIIEFVAVPLSEITPSVRVMVEPFPEVVTGGHLFHPVVQLSLLLRNPTWPQSIDENSGTIFGIGILVDAFGTDRYGSLVAWYQGRKKIVRDHPDQTIANVAYGHCPQQTNVR